MNAASFNPLVDFLTRPGQTQPVPAATLQSALGVSQATLSRMVREAGDGVVRIGKARATRYAATHSLGRVGRNWPLYRLDPMGRPHPLGRLHALARGDWWLSAEGARLGPVFANAEFRDGLYPGWPWFLDGQRPQGFLGRAFAHRVAPLLGSPADLNLWGDDDIALALLQYGHDAPGDLILGEPSLRRALDERSSPPNAILAEEREQHYPRLAEAALRGEPFGSSAAGEQPKFTATLAEVDGSWRPVIVKFSERLTTPGARRWADLLQGERLAAETLAAAEVAAAPTRILTADNRVFLESTRFDRTPTLGRIGMVPLAALDAAFYGHGALPWWQFAAQLRNDGWLAAEDATRLARLGWFGALIGNTDMHLGNVSLNLDDTRPLSLAPVYDMLPMRWRPAATGEVLPPDNDWRPPFPLPHETRDWLAAAALARAYWQQVIDAQERFSDDFRAIAQNALSAVERALAQVAH
ncbi:MAG: type II toxin-antitoxin system HipA family toxin YjjJ [Xanthomonadales bacterium]|nr:type II toxin-antitoxin system HipA family toxin YjjJ [Xanthomonadales bacterium]MBK7145165.1 type II toxin-antitoxin system HipA family toxin YjjJ [Xanthomonadales bacterium]